MANQSKTKFWFLVVCTSMLVPFIGVLRPGEVEVKMVCMLFVVFGGEHLVEDFVLVELLGNISQHPAHVGILEIVLIDCVSRPVGSVEFRDIDRIAHAVTAWFSICT